MTNLLISIPAIVLFSTCIEKPFFDIGNVIANKWSFLRSNVENQDDSKIKKTK